MAASSTVDQAVVTAIVAEVTNVLSFGGKMDMSINLDGFQATVSVTAVLAPDAPVLKSVKEPLPV